MSHRARLAIVVVAVAAGLALVFLWRTLAPLSGGGAADSASVAHAPVALSALEGASGWLNGGPLRADSLRGHPALFIVWSDTDPVSLDLLPEADAWQHAYGRYGLRVVGIHQPEYSFSADSAAAAGVVRRLGIAFPVALDAMATVGSRLTGGDEVPAWLIVDSEGRQVLVASGDRRDEVHRALRELLRREHPEAGLGEDAVESPAEPPVVRRVPCGTSRVTEGPIAHAVPGRTATFTAQFRFQEEGRLLTPYLVGRWTPASEGVTSARGGAAEFLALRYEGGRVDAVMGAGSAERIRVWVLRDDGWLPPDLRGTDVRADARGATFVDVEEPRLYSLARDQGAHVLKLSPEQPGATIYEFALRSE